MDRVTFRRLAENGRQQTHLNPRNQLLQHPHYPRRRSSWPLDMMAQQILRFHFLMLMVLHQLTGALSLPRPVPALFTLLPIGLLQKCLCD